MDIVEATIHANAWTIHARPIIRTYLTMDDVSISSAWLEASAMHRKAKRDGDKNAETEGFVRVQSYNEAMRYIASCQSSLYDMLEGIRDNYLADQCPPMPDDDDEAAWDARDAFNDELARSVISVDAAVRMVEGE